MKRPVIFWDVDTQHDFVDPDGKAPVPGADAVRPQLKRLTDYAHERQFDIVASAVDHQAGDGAGAAPELCLHGTPGARKIDETALFAPLVVETNPVSHESFARTLWSHSGDVLIHTRGVDVFANPNTKTLLDAWDPTEIVVYGVGLDTGVRCAIDGFIEHGVPEVHFVLDVTKPVHQDAVRPLLERWRREAVHVVTAADVLAGIIV